MPWTCRWPIIPIRPGSRSARTAILAGFVQYELGDNEIAFTHTQTDDRFRGHGLAGRLVQAALDEARERHLAVLPYCPFVKDWITRHREYADLVPEDRRRQFGL